MVTSRKIKVMFVSIPINFVHIALLNIVTMGVSIVDTQINSPRKKKWHLSPWTRRESIYGRALMKKLVSITLVSLFNFRSTKQTNQVKMYLVDTQFRLHLFRVGHYQRSPATQHVVSTKTTSLLKLLAKIKVNTHPCRVGWILGGKYRLKKSIGRQVLEVVN